MCHPTTATTFNLNSNRPATEINLFPNCTSTLRLGNSTTNPAKIQWNGLINMYRSVNNVSTISFPLYEQYIYRTTTTNFTVNLPIITSIHEGLRICLLKTASTALTQIITLICDVSNKIIECGTITESTTNTSLLGVGKTTCILVVGVLNGGGAYGWFELGSSFKPTLNNSFTAYNSFESGSTLMIRNGGILQFETSGYLNCNCTVLTPLMLSYVDGASSNIQNQITDITTNSSTFSGVKTFNQDITVNTTLYTPQIDSLTSSSNLAIAGNTTGQILIGSNTTANTIRFNNTLDLYSTQNITTSISLSIPLKSLYIIRTTSNIIITLPPITAFHVGKQIKIVKASGAISNIITLTADATNRILDSGQTAETTSNTSILGQGNASTTFIIGILASNLYGWIEINSTVKFNRANTWFNTNTFNSNVTFASNVVVNGATISTIEFSYLDGITSSIQNQINSKASLTANTFTGIQTFNGASNSFSGTNTYTGAGNYSALQTFNTVNPKISVSATASNDILTLAQVRKYYGCYLVNATVRYQILKSIPNLAINIYNQSATSGAVSTQQTGTAVGIFHPGPGLVNNDDYFTIYPSFGIIGYGATNYGGTIYLNYKNTTSSPVFVKASTTNLLSSLKLYYDDVELT